MVRDEEDINIYEIETNDKIDKKKKILIILIIIALILIIIVGKNIVTIIKGNKQCEIYEKQVAKILEEEQKKKDEEERTRQEKLPKLTEVGYAKYRKNI